MSWLTHSRRQMYRAGRVLGDVQAVKGGPTKMVKRAARKRMGRSYGRVMRAFIK